VALLAEGRGEEARRLVDRELAQARVGDSAYVEALYWRGRLAADAAAAERDLRRVAIEYSASKWADDALLQLTQLAYAAGNPSSALALAERLRNDYPDSDLRARAALWGGRAAFEAGDPAAACRLLGAARREAAGDVEFQNQIEFYHARCAATVSPVPPGAAAPVSPAPAADTSRRADRAAPAARPVSPGIPSPAAQPPTVSPAPPAAPAAFAVQVAAVRSEAAARAVLERLRRAGQEGRLEAGSDGLLHVRVGRLATQAEARALAERLRELIGGRPFVVRVQ
jgi:cell division septation protein DedD